MFELLSSEFRGSCDSMALSWGYGGRLTRLMVPDIEGIQNKVICLWIRTTCSVNIASTCSADLYDISRLKPSTGTPNLKSPRATKMKIRPWLMVFPKVVTYSKYHSLHMSGVGSAGNIYFLSIFMKHMGPYICCIFVFHGNHNVHCACKAFTHFPFAFVLVEQGACSYLLLSNWYVFCR